MSADAAEQALVTLRQQIADLQYEMRKYADGRMSRPDLLMWADRLHALTEPPQRPT